MDYGEIVIICVGIVVLGFVVIEKLNHNARIEEAKYKFFIAKVENEKYEKLKR